MRALMVTLMLAALALPLLASAEAELSSDELVRARETAVGASVTFDRLPLGGDRDGSVRMKRIDVYAPGARILMPEGEGYKELPRSDWLHFVADKRVDGAPRLGLSISADGRSARGILFDANGRTQTVKSSRFGNGLRFELRDAKEDENGAPTEFTCGNSDANWKSLLAPAEKLAAPGAKTGEVLTVASRSAVVAVDTDNELLLQKFSNNTTSATNYLAQLFAGLNVIYERDLDLTLTQGTTILRVSTTPDPYSASATSAQLTEFGNFWQNNQSGVNRAFAMLISGKSDNNFSSAGIAWVLGNTNYCQSTNGSLGGHYSVSQVFKFNGATAADDLLVVAHELGHNFGAQHAHCSNITTGAGPTATNTIDQCFVEGGGCYNGPTSCPAPSTVNGVTGVRGTLMSYCHLSGISGCDSSEVFANGHRTLLNPRVAANVTAGCFTAVGGNNIFANGFE
ncbi:MAG: M12 family metallo-peptidase [Lysobacterales bacterium]